MKKLILIATAALACACANSNEATWTDLFNGQDLSGWKQVTGLAEYKVEEGCIVGTCVKTGGINSFLATKKDYSDFIIEYEFLLDSTMNSGVQFRSRVNPGTGKMTGYQCEADPSDRAWSAGIYDEARRGWLYPLTFNQKGRKAYRKNEWNKGRIEAIGSHIRTYLNGVLCSDLIDDMDADGQIGLQVHATNLEERIGSQVRWKNIRICTANPEKHTLKPSNEAFQINSISNTLSEKQKSEGWKLLWDGKTTEGWRSAKAESFPDRGWSIADGELIVAENDGTESTNGGDIITTEKYKDFWLSVEFKITTGANSGIKYFVNPELYKSTGSAIGCEYQILDDKVHPDAQLGVAGNRTLGSLYDLIRADKDEARFRYGQWNTAWIKVQGTHVEHWLNGVKILEYERNNQMFNALVAYSKYKNWKNFGNHETGHILLQDHGNEVHFKSIMIKEL